MPVPYIFANQTGPIPLAELDANFAATPEYANTAGQVIGNTQPNIHTIGALNSLTVTGNITTYANIAVTNNISVGGTIIGNVVGNITGNTTGNITGSAATVRNNSQPNITTVGTLTSLAVTGNIIGNGIISITGNVYAGTIYGNINANVGNANYANTATFANRANVASYANNLVSSGQANITQLGLLTAVSVNGNISATGNIFAGSNFYGNLIGNVSFANIATRVIANDQPNITSVGNLTSLNVTGNISVAGQVTSNLVIQTAVYANNTTRDATITSPQPGMIIFNEQGSKFQGYTGSGWDNLN